MFHRDFLQHNRQLITELELLQRHLEQVETEITQIVENSREGKILLSIPGIGPVQAATIIASIGNIANFERASQLKSYFGWAPSVAQSGSTLHYERLTPRGQRQMKRSMLLIVWNVMRYPNNEWARIYERLVRRKCSFNEKTRQYTGRLTVVGRIAGQIISTIFVLLKQDQELLARLPPGTKPPEPALYDPEVHRRHCAGHYQAYTRSKLSNIIELPPH